MPPVIEPGKALGPYQVIEAIGAGGMGEVYKARDTRLDRIVAVKVLPAHLTEHADSRERFEREARAVSGLNHPNICTLYDIGRQDEIDFLVLEYLEGETLADRIARSPIPLDEALKYAIQIVGALDKAHRHGVIHRDLKPANIMLTKAGTKLLDFGLAKFRAAQTAASSMSGLATGLPPESLTGQGVIVGTLQYMAPEQLEGADADARTDIFAFGSVLYEMITGRRAFQGKSQPSLISSIMSGDPPPLSSIQTMAPPALEHVVKTCLAKDPADRWQTAHDVMAHLKWIAEGSSQSSIAIPVAGKRHQRDRLTTVMLAIVTLLVIAMSAPTFYYFRGEPSAPEIRFDFSTPIPPNPTSLSVSPNGEAVTFSAISSTGIALYVRRLNQVSWEQLAGTEGGTNPFWSPDSRYIGFFAFRKLKKVAVNGGVALDICECPQATGTWNEDGTILFGNSTNGIFSVSENGGTPNRLDESGFFPTFLPGGRHFLYTSLRPEPGIYVRSLDTRDDRLVVSGISSSAYADSYLFYLRQGTLFAHPFDPDKLAVQGEPSRVVDQVAVGLLGRGAFSISRTGVIAYRPGTGTTAKSQLSWHDRSGKKLQDVGQPDAYAPNFDLSPDAKHVALSKIESGVSNIWLMEWSRGVTTKLTNLTAEAATATGRDVVWSPDGLRLVYSIRPKGSADIFEKQASGLGSETAVVDSPSDEYVEDWSRDGKYILYLVTTSNGTDIWAMPLFGDRKPMPLVQSPSPKDEPHFSFDGKWIAFNSMESGVAQVYVMSFPSLDQKRQISTNGGSQARWRQDGKELFYLAGDGKMMAVDMSVVNGRIDSGSPRVLFETGLSVDTNRDQYAVTADGQRFLLLKPLGEALAAPITVVVNWKH